MKISSRDFHLFKQEVMAWSRWKKLRRPFGGLHFFYRHSNGALCIASRHWPHLLCWSWVFVYDPCIRRGDGPFYCRYDHNSGGFIRVGPYTYTWQNYDWMVGMLHERECASYLLRHITKGEAK